MNILPESRELLFIMSHLKMVAAKSTCKRSKCGSIVVSLGEKQILGEGFNSMPCNAVAECFKDSLPAGFKSDKTCCVHAEQRAIMNTLSGPAREKIFGSAIFFIRLDENGNPKHSGRPYCSICSKMALDSGIATFVLWHKEGWTAYGAKEYNDLTFKYDENGN